MQPVRYGPEKIALFPVLVFLLGTVPQGRDILSVILYGSRVSLLIGAASVLLAMLIGAVDTMEAGSDAWRRPVALVEDAIRTERPARPLPPQSPLPGTAFDSILG